MLSRRHFKSFSQEYFKTITLMMKCAVSSRGPAQSRKVSGEPVRRESGVGLGLPREPERGRDAGPGLVTTGSEGDGGPMR